MYLRANFAPSKHPRTIRAVAQASAPAQVFGVFQNEAEYGEVAWRFSPEAAAHARGCQFHPEQELEEQTDGSLIVRFHAAGHLEMCWHLYTWGHHVEVLRPARLRNMVEGYQRADFPALP